SDSGNPQRQTLPAYLLSLRSWPRQDGPGGRAVQNVFYGDVATRRLAIHAGGRFQRILATGRLEEISIESPCCARKLCSLTIAWSRLGNRFWAVTAGSIVVRPS